MQEPLLREAFEPYVSISQNADFSRFPRIEW
jgi:hypothetical protein